MAKKQKLYKHYLAAIPMRKAKDQPMELWDKIEAEFNKQPLLKDRRNSYNRIINKALTKYFER